MADKSDDSEKRSRVTLEDLARIKRFYREGLSISDIAAEVGFHRHTIRKHLQEKYEDIVAAEARKQVLAEELKNHFKQLKTFALTDLKSWLDASVPGLKRLSKPRIPGPISVSGVLGLPCPGTALFMSEEWVRMYNPSQREKHLLKSLQPHTECLSLWASWDTWRKKVSAYERTSRYLWEWLEERLEETVLEKIKPEKIELIGRWIFGNMLVIAGGGEQDGLGTFRTTVFDPAGVTMGRDQDKDTDGSRLSFELLSGILKEVQHLSRWEEFKSAVAELASRDRQRELRRLAGDIDDSLVDIELMGAFGGYCTICPIKQPE